MLKIWRLTDLIFENYKEYIENGFLHDEWSDFKRPRIIQIEEPKNEVDVIHSADISTCGTYVGVVKSRTEVLILECFPNFATEGEWEAKGKTLWVRLHNEAYFI